MCRYTRLFTLFMVISLSSFLSSCVDIGGSDSTPDEPDVIDEVDNPPPEDDSAEADEQATESNGTEPVLSGYDIVLKQGDFWEYQWDYYASSFAQGSSSSKTNISGKFWVVLGESKLIDGVEAYSVKVIGESNVEGETEDFTPRWSYIAWSDSKLLGSESGSGLETIFDAKNGEWVGGGFFVAFPGNLLITASPSAISNDYINASADVVGRSNSESQCVYYPETGSICGDSSFSYSEYEYYKENVGPVGYYYANSFEDCGGGFCSGATWRANIGLTATSFQGDSNPLVNEEEPNDQIATAQQVNLPAIISGDLANGDGFSVHDFIFDGKTFNPSVYDWYRFTLVSDSQFKAIMDFEGSPSLTDLDLYIFNETGDEVLQVSINDNADLGVYKEGLEIDLEAGNYLLAVIVYATDEVTRVDYSLELE